MTTAVTDQPRQNIIQAFRDYGKKLSLFIRGRVESDEEAEDILQDVWYRFIRVMNTEPIEQVSGWLYRVAKNRIIDGQRKEKSLRFEVEDQEAEDLSLSAFFSATASSPENKELRELFWENLTRALDELPSEQREVFIMNEIEEIPFHEIAGQTGENINTLISRKRYAVLHLRKRLRHLHQEIIQQ